MANPADGIDWQAPQIVEGKGIIAAPTGIEEKPCFTCKSWDKNREKLIQFLVSKGMRPKPNGCYDMAVIAGDLPGRRQMEVDPKDFGFCQNLCMPTHMMATCEHWKPTLSREDLAGKIVSRR